MDLRVCYSILFVSFCVQMKIFCFRQTKVVCAVMVMRNLWLRVIVIGMEQILSRFPMERSFGCVIELASLFVLCLSYRINLEKHYWCVLWEFWFNFRVFLVVVCLIGGVMCTMVFWKRLIFGVLELIYFEVYLLIGRVGFIKVWWTKFILWFQNGILLIWIVRLSNWRHGQFGI